MNVNFFYPCDPKPQPRPRFRVARNRVFCYTKSDVRDYKAGIALFFKSKGFPVQSGPLAVWIQINVVSGRVKGIPKDFTGETAHFCRPDIDNYVKGVFDALNGVAWLDDGQICFISARKVRVFQKEKAGIMMAIEPYREDLWTFPKSS